MTLVSALATTRPLGPQLGRGAFAGTIGAAGVAVWVLLRGAREWLVAPYGFDIALLIIVLAFGVVLVSAMCHEGVCLPADGAGSARNRHAPAVDKSGFS